MVWTRTLVHATIGILVPWSFGTALGAQAAALAGDAGFPPRRAYSHGHDVQNRYDRISDVSRVSLDLASNNVLPLLRGPLVHRRLSPTTAARHLRPHPNQCL